MTTTRTLRRWGRLIVVAMLALVAYTMTPQQPLTWGANECKAQWCQPGAVLYEGQRMIDEQVAATPCTPGHALVRGAEHDRSVVWSMSTTEVQAINWGESWDNVIVVRSCA